MEDYKTLFQEALICKQNNNPDEAEELYLKVLELEPDLTEAYYNLATIYYDRNDCQKAVDCYKKILEINPENFFQEVLLSPEEKSIYSRMLALSNVSNFDVFTTR